MTELQPERTVYEASLAEREAVIALTLAAYGQYAAVMPSGAGDA